MVPSIAHPGPHAAILLGFAFLLSEEKKVVLSRVSRLPVQPITGADLSPDGKSLLIECYGGIYEVTLPTANLRDLTQDHVLRSRRQLPAPHLGQVRQERRVSVPCAAVGWCVVVSASWVAIDGAR